MSITNKIIQGSLLALTALTCVSSNAAECKLTDVRLCSINKKLQLFTGGHPVIYEELARGEIKSKAEAEWIPGGPDVIRVASSYEFNNAELTYLVAHEFGHLYLRHSRKELENSAEPKDRQLSDTELAAKYGTKYTTYMDVLHENEFDADKFAARFMMTEGMNPYRVIRRALENAVTSATHPAKADRLKRLEALQN